MLTLSRLKELLHYNPETGEFSWLISKGSCAVGAVAGTPNDKGYMQITIDGTKYGYHRLAVLYMTGEWPEEVVDHLDGDPTNNRWSNLRCCRQAINLRRRRSRTDNASGHTGVYWSKCRNKWHAHIQVEGKRKHLGYFVNLEDAVSVRASAEAALGFSQIDAPRYAPTQKGDYI